jgi:O-antigen/teichoic acid export membrane protein
LNSAIIAADRRLAFARLLSSAVVSQALLSAASLAVGLILIRRSSDVQYGFYILASNSILLLASLQNAFFGPPLATRINQLDEPGRRSLIGGLHFWQRRLSFGAAALVIFWALLSWYMALLERATALLVIAAAVAGIAVLHREYFRIVLLAFKRPQDVLRTDIFYVTVLVGGAFAATWISAVATATILSLSAAALLSGILLARSVRRQGSWRSQCTAGLLRDVAPLAAWSTAGAAIHWTFSQGYIYLVAAQLDVAAVAAIAATRLLMMPINLLSSGIGSLMLPLASTWLNRHGPGLLFRRLVLFALGLATVTAAYFAVLWLCRDWLFAVVLKKNLAQRDALLMLWAAVFLLMVVRDQLVYLLAAQGRFRTMTLLTLVSAVMSLSLSYWAMPRFGVVGALMGLLMGEMISLSGVIIFSCRYSSPVVGMPARAM